VGALFWESMGVTAFLRDGVALALLAHALCAASLACAAASSSLMLRSRTAACLGVWAFCVPVLVPLGLCSVLLPALHRKRMQRSDELLELGSAHPQLSAPRAPAEQALPELLMDRPGAAGARVEALLSLRNTELSRAVPLLRLALLDANEDLRLLAYAMLERKEKQLRARIESSKRELAQLLDAAPRRELGLLWQLCADQLQLATAGFVSGAAAVRALADAREYGERALRQQNDGALRVLLARVCLCAREPELAQGHLTEAAKLGTARSVLAPLHAHAAFQQGRYTEVAQRLRVSDAAQLARAEEQSVRALWAGLAVV
jgi:hypothetical protein